MPQIEVRGADAAEALYLRAKAEQASNVKGKALLKLLGPVKPYGWLLDEMQCLDLKKMTREHVGHAAKHYDCIEDQNGGEIVEWGGASTGKPTVPGKAPSKKEQKSDQRAKESRSKVAKYFLPSNRRGTID